MFHTWNLFWHKFLYNNETQIIYMVSSMMALTMSLALFCRAFTAFPLETLAWVGRNRKLEERMASISNHLTHDQVDILVLNPLSLHSVIFLLLLLWDRGRASHCTHVRHLIKVSFKDLSIVSSIHRFGLIVYI